MADFADWFRATYGARFPVTLAEPLVELAPSVFGSRALAGIEAPVLPEFRDGLGSYVLAGAWGHGVSSYAFYLVEKRDPHRRFFRLLSGGVYAPPDPGAVVAFLERYEAWRAASEHHLDASTIIANMGRCTVELTRDGRSSALDVDEDRLFEALAAARG